MPNTPTQEEFDHKYPGLTQEQFDQKYFPQEPSQTGLPGMTNTVKDVFRGFLMDGPYTGQTSDQMFSGGSVGKIMSAFGQSFHDSWDSEPSLLQGELDKEAREKDVGLLTALRNSAMKPAAAAIDAVTKAPFAVMGGVAGATEETAEQLGSVAYGLQNNSLNPNWGVDTPWQKIRVDPGSVLGLPFAIGAEVFSGAAHGALLEGGLYGHSVSVDHIQQISEARSKGVIGEGEAGYFKVKPPTPEDLEARESAAHDAGTWTPKFQEGAFSSIEDHVPTVPELARQMDPDTFNELDRLQKVKDKSIDLDKFNYWRQRQQEEFDRQENAVLRKTDGDESALSQEDKDSLQNIRDTRRQASELPTPEEINLRQKALDADIGIRDLLPKIADAQNRADELLNSDSEEGERYRKFVQAQAFERAMALEPIKAKAEETLRLANDLKEANAPKETPKPKTKTDTLKSTPIEKQPEVKLDPDGGIPRKKVQGTGDKTPLSTNQRLQLDAVIKGWKSQVGDVPQEEILKNEQQLSDALRFYEESPGLAEKVAMGDAPVPDGYNIHPEAVLRILKKQAEDTGDHELGLRLAETKLAGEHRDIGQRLQLLNGLHDIDPVSIIQDLNKTMSEKAKKAITKAREQIQESIDEAMATFKPDIEKFLKAIECE